MWTEYRSCDGVSKYYKQNLSHKKLLCLKLKKKSNMVPGDGGGILQTEVLDVSSPLVILYETACFVDACLLHTIYNTGYLLHILWLLHNNLNTQAF